jgi:hypothetical protein
LFGLLVLVPGPADAQQAEVIHSFDVQYVINGDGSFDVTEDIVYDFGSQQRHGIFRYVPVEYEYEPDPNYRRVTRITSISVDDGSERIPFTTSRRGTNLELKIGDPDELITGRHRYRIRYTVEGGLNPQPQWDELYWNVTGNDWNVTILNASATVIAPSIEMTDCFQGPTGSTERCLREDGQPPVFRTSRFQGPGAGLTVVVALTKGSVEAPPLELVKIKSAAEKVRDFIGFKPLPLAATAFLAVTGPIALARYWWLSGRDKWYGDVHYLTEKADETTKPMFAKDTVVVEYTPPEILEGRGRIGRPLRPAEIGTLLDERADTLDVTATIVDLAVRGYLRITEVPKTWLFGSTDYKLDKLKDADDALLTYESVLLRSLFEDGDSVEMSDLKNKFYTDLKQVKTSLYSQVVTKDKFFAANPENVRTYHRVAGFGLIAAGVLAAYGLGTLLGAAIIGVPIAVLGVVLLVASGWMPRRTGKGRETYRRALGFREYMEVAETDRQRFNEEENIFEKYLPYAMVYGCVEKWAEAFEGLEGQPQDTNRWYVSPHPFRPLAFTASMNSFSSSMSSAIASTPGGSGSSGFSGGGSSGGGGGGGGGGSW